eukprot:3775729-Amphidinium_carterae.1
MPGVMLVDKQQDLEEIFGRVQKSAYCQVVVSATKLQTPKGIKDPELTDLTIVIEKGSMRVEQEAHLYVYHLAGPSPTLRAQCAVIQLGQMNTLVLRVSLTKLLTGRGAWINWAGTHKDVLATLKKITPETAAMVTDAWQPKTMANTGACMMRVQRTALHRFLQQATAEGFSASMMREDDETQVIWLKDRNLPDAIAASMELLQGIEETRTWHKASALFVHQKDGKLSFGLRVPPQHKDRVRA